MVRSIGAGAVALVALAGTGVALAGTGVALAGTGVALAGTGARCLAGCATGRPPVSSMTQIVVENLAPGRPLTPGGTQVWTFDLVNVGDTARKLDRSAFRVVAPDGWSFDGKDPRLPACTRDDLIVGAPAWPAELAARERRTLRFRLTLELNPQSSQHNCTGVRVPMTVLVG